MVLKVITPLTFLHKKSPIDKVIHGNACVVKGYGEKYQCIENDAIDDDTIGGMNQLLRFQVYRKFWHPLFVQREMQSLNQQQFL